MRTKKLGLFFIVLIILVISAVFVARVRQKQSSNEIMKEIQPTVGSMRTFISSTGTVLPKNR